MIYSLPIEHWSNDKKTEVLTWMQNTFNNKSWGVEKDYGLETLWMNNEIYLLFVLKWNS